MQYDTEEGAVAFVQFYTELTTYAYNTLDTTELERVADDNCVGCNSTLSNIATLIEGGYSTRGSEVSIDSVRSSTYYRDDNVFIVEMDHTYGAAELIGPNGEVLRTDPEVSGSANYVVRYNGPNDWTMIAFGTIE